MKSVEDYLEHMKFVRVRWLLVGIILITLVAAVAFMFQWRNHREAEQRGTDLLSAQIDDATLLLEVVSTPEEQQRGLSGRASLGEGKGMLFVYDRDNRYGFWMPDMHFSIDILWLDSLMRIVHIEESVSPESYPTVFKPTVPARYVLEVPAGWTVEHGIVKGDTLVPEKQ